MNEEYQQRQIEARRNRDWGNGISHQESPARILGCSIRGPDFVWAATGPALEAYSQHPAVRKANAPGELLSVSEFLQHVRRIVVDFVVGQVLKQSGAEAVSGMDEVTTYKVRLKPWNQRFRKSLGLDCENRAAPMIDQAHRLMHLWKAGDVIKVDEYLDARASQEQIVCATTPGLNRACPDRQRGTQHSGKSK